MIVTPKYGLLEYHDEEEYWTLNVVRPTAVSAIDERRRLAHKGVKLHLVLMEQMTDEQAIQQDHKLFTADQVRELLKSQRKDMVDALTKVMVSEPHGEWDAGHSSAVRECIQTVQKM